jgi:tetratricopeptide (TPR) repeat protein
MNLLFVLVLLAGLPAFGQQLDNAKELLRRGKPAEALPLLRPSLGSSQPNPEAWALLAEAYLQLGHPDSAAIVARRIVDEDDANPQGYVLAARAFLAQQKTSEALAVLRKGLRVRKIATGPLWTELGYVFLTCDSTKAAIAAFTQAKEAEPTNPAVFEGLGEAYSREGIPVMAIEHYERVLQLDSTRSTTAYRLARLYGKERRYNEAARLYQQCIQQDSTNSLAYLELGRLYYLARQYANAARYLSSYTERRPDSIAITLLASEAHLAARSYDQAATLAQRVLQRDSTAVKAIRITAHALVHLHLYQQALPYFDRLGRLDTLQAEDMKLLGKVYHETGNDSLAGVFYGRALEQRPDDADLYGELGAVLMKTRAYERAAWAFQKRYTLDPTAVSAYVNYGLSNMALARWDTARAAFRQAILLRPQYLQSHLFLARCLVQLDSLREATQEYRTVLQLADSTSAKNAEERAEAYGMIGFWHLREKRYPQAVELLTMSIRLKEDNPQTHLWLAQTFALWNKREEAVREYQRVLKLDPSNKDAKKGLEILGHP